MGLEMKGKYRRAWDMGAEMTQGQDSWRAGTLHSQQTRTPERVCVELQLGVDSGPGGKTNEERSCRGPMKSTSKPQRGGWVMHGKKSPPLATEVSGT